MITHWSRNVYLHAAAATFEFIKFYNNCFECMVYGVQHRHSPLSDDPYSSIDPIAYDFDRCSDWSLNTDQTTCCSFLFLYSSSSPISNATLNNSRRSSATAACRERKQWRLIQNSRFNLQTNILNKMIRLSIEHAESLAFSLCIKDWHGSVRVYAVYGCTAYAAVMNETKTLDESIHVIGHYICRHSRWNRWKCSTSQFHT